jgi:IclR family transcriptional regulator, acetate operon repressor
VIHDSAERVPHAERLVIMDAIVAPQRNTAPEPEWRVPTKDFLRASGQVQSLSRALKLLSALSHHLHGLTLSEAAEMVGLPASTAHRLLSTLQNERFVRYDNERGRWLVGLQAFRIGQAFAHSRDPAQAARPFMKRLAEQTGETATLAVVERGEVHMIVQHGGQKAHRAKSPFMATAAEKVISAYAPAGANAAELAAIRSCGYAVVDEDNTVGLRAIAAAVFNENGVPLAGLSISGPIARIGGARIGSLGDAVFAAAREITAELGGKPATRNGAA